MKILRPLWIALQLLTRFPAPDTGAPDSDALGHSLLFYPVVGLLVGGLLAGAGWQLSGHLPPMLVAAVLLALWVAITGALHLDGLADSADGWLGGHGDRERTLRIMHDPRSGPAAITAVGLVLLLKFASLVALAESRSWLELIWVPVMARALVTLLFLTTTCAQPHGMAASLAARLPRGSAWIAVVLGMLPMLAAGSSGGYAAAAGLGTFVWLRRIMLARIGGMSGDTAGALVEISETAALIALVAASAHA